MACKFVKGVFIMSSKKIKLDELFDKWEDKHLSEGHEDFIRDGIVDIEAWEHQTTPKVCFLLKEAYGDRFDLAEKLKNEGAFSETWFNGAIWAQAVYDAFMYPFGNVIPFNGDKLANIKKNAHSIIQCISVVNIKKSDGECRSDNADLRNFAISDADELKEELQIINPRIIICGNIWDIVKDTVFEGKAKELAEIPEVYRWMDSFIISYYHPAYFTIKDEFHYYTIREICRGIRKNIEGSFYDGKL